MFWSVLQLALRLQLKSSWRQTLHSASVVQTMPFVTLSLTQCTHIAQCANACAQSETWVSISLSRINLRRFAWDAFSESLWVPFGDWFEQKTKLQISVSVSNSTNVVIFASVCIDPISKIQHFKISFACFWSILKRFSICLEHSGHASGNICLTEFFFDHFSNDSAFVKITQDTIRQHIFE